MQLLGDITQGELSRASGISTTTISLFLRGKRKLRPAMAARLVEGLERAFVRKGSRLDTAFFAADAEISRPMQPETEPSLVLGPPEISKQSAERRTAEAASVVENQPPGG